MPFTKYFACEKYFPFWIFSGWVYWKTFDVIFFFILIFELRILMMWREREREKKLPRLTLWWWWAIIKNIFSPPQCATLLIVHFKIFTMTQLCVFHETRPHFFTSDDEDARRGERGEKKLNSSQSTSLRH